MSDVILPDRMIGKYRVIRELGRGATSAVYRADDSFNKRRVAIKVMYPEVLKDHADATQYRIMFLSEASLAGKMIHPHPKLDESIGMAAEVAHGSCTDLPSIKK